GYNDAVSYSWYQGALQAQSVGMTTITVPWEVKVPFREWSMYHSNGEVLDRTKHRVLGASRPMWEQSAETIVNRWLAGMAERQERTWGPDTKVVDDEFRAREKAAKARMNRLVRPVHIKEDVKILKRIGERAYYGEPATITMTADAPAGCKIHYTINGDEPKPTSEVYQKPLRLTGKLRIRAALFDESGEMIGGVNFGEKYDYRGFEKNLTTGKPVKASGMAGEKEKPEYAADGWIGNGKLWGAWKPPQWWQVDLQQAYNLDRVRLFPWAEGGRAFQYTIEVS
ncbi:unnamed protein product, partial [marine sediment metagenome]